MRRKIEKYLAKKQGIDDGQVEPGEDGRYDFMGDFDGVLSAVRGNDPMTDSGKKRSESKLSLLDSADRSIGGPQQQHGNNLPIPYYSHYTPYGMGPTPVYHMGPSHMMQQRPNPHYTPWAHGSQNHKMKATPTPSPLAALQHVTLSTPAAVQMPQESYGDHCMSAAHKSIFDVLSPQGKMVAPRSSPGHMSIQGMTPPMSCLKDIFATPGPPENPSPKLSMDEAASVNKSLFADNSSVLTPFNDGESTTPIKSIHIHMTEQENSITDMTLGNRVSISPIHRDQTTYYFGEEEKETMPPPSSLRGAPVLSSDLFAMTPRDLTKKDVMTPSTAANSSFWSEMSMSLSPFRTPASPMGSMSKKRARTDQ